MHRTYSGGGGDTTASLGRHVGGFVLFLLSLSRSPVLSCGERERESFTAPRLKRQLQARWGFGEKEEKKTRREGGEKK